MKFNFVIPKEKSMALLYILNGTLMGMHCIFLVFFAFNHVTFMTVVNIFSIITYLCNFIVLRKQFLRASSIIVFVEIIVHMFLTILCVGTGSGFQQYYIGCAAVIFFMEYFIQRLGKQPANSLLLCAIDGVCYLTSVYLSWTRGAKYELKPFPTMVMQLFNLFVVFVFITMFLLAIMVKTASYYEGELTRQAEHDRLTGMYNRQYMIEYLTNVENASDRPAYWLSILDIDDFKKFNDRHGHNCGDYVLCEISRIISMQCRRQVSCRWGGEEFLILGHAGSAPDAAQKEAKELLEMLRREVEHHSFVYQNQRLVLTITLGMQVFDNSSSIDEWINSADQKLYVGKSSGKNQLVC